MSNFGRTWTLVGVVMTILVRVAGAQLTTTTVHDTVYRADGTVAGGTVVVSWSAFTTAAGNMVPNGTTSVTIGSGGSLTVALSPNAGATPMGSYYTAVFHLNDGSTSREYWVIPVTVAGGGPTTLSAIRNSVLPASVAMQSVSKSYVDTAIAAAVTSGTISVARLPAFGPSGTTHSAGIVPDPGLTAGATRFLREDGTFAVPAGGGGGITSLTGDGTASGSGVAALTLATVNSSPGTFGSTTTTPVITVDSKGRITTASSATVSGGGGAAFQSNGSTLTSSTAVNFRTGTGNGGVVVTNPSAGNVDFNLSLPLGGTGAGIPTGPTSGTTNGHLVIYNGTTGQQADSTISDLAVALLSSQNNFTSNNTFAGVIFGSTTFTIASGCGTTTSLTGGRQAGTFLAGQISCVPVITPGFTAPHGFSCWSNDLTTNADIIHQIATTTTTATLSGTVVSGDTINFGCVAY